MLPATAAAPGRACAGADHTPTRAAPLLRPARTPARQHLDLSNCCLTRVPAALARLPHLTSLTLNENDALGGSAAALAPLAALTALEVLEMRECGLTAVPASVAGLTRLRSLLMGYNAMTEVRPAWGCRWAHAAQLCPAGVAGVAGSCSWCTSRVCCGTASALPLRCRR